MIKPVRLQDSPIASFDLGAIGDALIGEDAYGRSSHTGASLVKGDDLRFVLTVGKKGATVRDHSAPSPAVVVVLDGEIVLRFPEADEQRQLTAGGAAAFDAGVRHSVEFIEDARFLIVIGGHREAQWPSSTPDSD